MNPIMHQPSSRTAGTTRAALAGLLLALLAAAAPVALARSTPVSRNFLPPVATINGPIETQQATLAPTDNDAAVENLALTAVTAPSIRLKPRIEKLEKTVSLLNANEKAELDKISSLQQELDDDDLKSLWEATVDRNPVIRFSLEKIYTPTDLQPQKSSLFYKKVLNTAIQGAMLTPMLFPVGNSYANMGVLSAGQGIQNIVNGNNKPQPEPLSATEQIQLAGLIDELKAKLVQTYHNYKNTLLLLTEAHDTTEKNNAVYNKALRENNALSQVASASAYYQALMNETQLRQKAILHRLQLERLAGQDAVSDLKLALFFREDSQTETAGQPAGPSRTSVASQPSPGLLGKMGLAKTGKQPAAPPSLKDPPTGKTPIAQNPAGLPPSSDDHLMLMEHAGLTEFTGAVIGPMPPQ
ncbi:MAG: hypothetical protein AB7P76_02630 [Candidatus Melainabacteria bacterium]